MKFIRIIFIFFILSATKSCIYKTPQSQEPQIYFSLHQFIQTQVAKLDSSKPTFNKTVVNEGKKASQSLQIKEWKKELRMFEEANINKPAFKDMYVVKDSTAQNRVFKIYRSKDKNFHTQFLLIEYDAAKQIKMIQVLYQTNDFLFQSKRDLQLICENGLLKSYSIEGHQNNLFSGKYDYEIAARR